MSLHFFYVIKLYYMIKPQAAWYKAKFKNSVAVRNKMNEYHDDAYLTQ